MMDLVHVWSDDRCWSKILHSAIPTPIHDLKIKVTDLELLFLSFTLKVFRTSLFPNPIHELKVKVTDFVYFVLNFYSVSFCKAFDWFMFGMNGYDSKMLQKGKGPFQESFPV